MARNALLIGSETFGLTGVRPDVALMADVLRSRDFDTTVCLDDLATRQGMTDHLNRLVDTTSAGDAVVIYYSGHGGREVHPDWQAQQTAGKRPFLHFLVPTDFDERASAGFGGLLSEELSRFQRRLTAITPNVTVILDCCHSGTLARNQLVAKAVATGVALDEAWVRRVIAEDAAVETNPDAVRLVACAPEQSAYEGPSARFGGRHGYLTESLAVVLEQSGRQPISWWTLIHRIRARIDRLSPQRPEVEGPHARVPFGLEQRSPGDAVPVVMRDGGPTIESAALFGIRVGARFRLVEGSGHVVADARVIAIQDDRAVLAPEAGGAGQPLPAELLAVPHRFIDDARPVRLEDTGAATDLLRQRIEATARLVVAPSADAERPLAVVRNDGGLVIDDATGDRLRSGAEPLDEAGVDRTVVRLDLLARVEHLRSLVRSPASAGFEPIRLELRRVGPGGDRVPCRPSGERLAVGDRISLLITNTTASPLYLWVFDIGISRRIQLVTNAEPSGALLTAEGTPGSVREVWGEGPGELRWPEDVPADRARPESLVVVVTDRRQDLWALEVDDRTGPRYDVSRSGLTGLLTGGREIVTVERTDPPYRVEEITFLVTP
jgi:hypothetical protein